MIDGTSSPVEAETTFALSVNPCIITDFSSPTNDGSVIPYTLGDPGIAFGSFIFEQNPACGYTEEVKASGLPSFITLDTANKQLILTETSDISFVQTFNIEVASQIKQPEDNSATPTYKIFNAALNFEIQVSNPCTQAVLDPINIIDMTSSVNGEADIQDLTLKLPKDDVSARLGD